MDRIEKKLRRNYTRRGRNAPIKTNERTRGYPDINTSGGTNHFFLYFFSRDTPPKLSKTEMNGQWLLI